MRKRFVLCLFIDNLEFLLTNFTYLYFFLPLSIFFLLWVKWLRRQKKQYLGIFPLQYYSSCSLFAQQSLFVNILGLLLLFFSSRRSMFLLLGCCTKYIGWLFLLLWVGCHLPKKIYKSKRLTRSSLSQFSARVVIDWSTKKTIRRLFFYGTHLWSDPDASVYWSVQA